MSNWLQTLAFYTNRLLNRISTRGNPITDCLTLVEYKVGTLTLNRLI